MPPVNGKTLKQLGLGVVVNAVADGAVGAYYNRNIEQLEGQFPFIRPLPFLPPVEDWIYVGVPAAIYLATRKRGNESTRNTALGAFLYGAGMFVHHMIINIEQDLREGFNTIIPPGTLRRTATAKSGVQLKGYLPSHPKPLNQNILII